MTSSGARPRRVAVIGTSGSGKTTFSAALAARLGVPHVEFDALYWLPDWQEPEPEAWRATIEQTLDEADGWVADGNYSNTMDAVIARADTIVWLDIGMVTCLRRVTIRAFRRASSGELLWGTNREQWRQVVGRNSLGWWVITTHGRRRRETEQRFENLALRGLRLLRFRSNAAADRWLGSA